MAGRFGGEWTAGASAAGMRLDRFLAAADRVGSRARAAGALDRGKVFVNGVEVGLAAAGRRLVEGDRIRVWMDRPGSARRRGALGDARDLPIVYEDEALLVINKAAGVLAVPLPRGDDSRSVFADVKRYLKTRRAGAFVVHRIDRDTSGLVVFATRPETQEALKQQFLRHEPERVYRAIVYGHPTPDAGTWRDRLVWDPKALIQKKTHPHDPRGKEAISEYRVVERHAETSLIEVRLVTGKRNQIRLQARLRGHTLVGERRYVFGPDHLRPIAFPRQALHAFQLAFRHPVTGAPMTFEAPLPDDMRELLTRLRREM
jgi:23S rRNA pseudouridine1911/1915/1917 synthase